MYTLPLAPHEIDALPNAERVHATVYEAKESAETGLDEEFETLELEVDDLRRGMDDLYGELNDLLTALDTKDGDKIERAKHFAKLALERHKE